MGDALRAAGIEYRIEPVWGRLFVRASSHLALPVLARVFGISSISYVEREISADLDLMVAAIREMAETGDFAAVETPDVTAASERVHAYALESCGWATGDVATAD